MKELKRNWNLLILIVLGLAIVLSVVLFFNSSGIVHEIARWAIFFISAFFAGILHNIIWPKAVQIKNGKD